MPERQSAPTDTDRLTAVSVPPVSPDDLPYPVLRLSPAGDILYLNPAAEQWLKNLPDDGSEPLCLPSGWADTLETAVRQNQPVTLEWRWNQRVYTCRFVPTAQYVDVFAFDITEYKAQKESLAQLSRIEQLLVDQHRRLEALQPAEAGADGVASPQQVLDLLAERTATVLDVQTVAVYEWDRSADRLAPLLVYHHGSMSPVSEDAPLSRVGQPQARQALSGRRPVQYQTDEETFLLLPMNHQGRLVGLTILQTARRRFDDYEVGLAQLLTDQITGAYENARLYDEVHQRIDELTVLYTISQVITSTLNLEEMLSIITDLTTRLLNVAATSVVLYDETRTGLYYAAASGKGASYILGKKLERGQGITGWVIEHGEPVIVQDVRQDPRFYDRFDHASGFETRSILCVPLQTKGRIIGAVAALNKQNGTPRFDEQDLRLLTSLAASAAIAIENARLYERAKRETAERMRTQMELEINRQYSRIYAQHVEALEILHEVGLKLMENLDTASVLRLIGQAVSDLLPESAGCAMFFFTEPQWLLPPVYTQPANIVINGNAEAIKAAARQVAEKGEARYIRDITAEAGKSAPAVFRSLLLAPLVDRQAGPGFGALSVFSPQVDAFNESQQYILSILANQAAVALRKASFFEQRAQQHEQEKQAIRNLFQRYVSPAVVERLVQDRAQLKLGGERQEVTVLFADIRGFTAYSENLPPEMLVEVLNRYFTMAVEPILAEDGTLDKFMGDAVMAFFNAPLPQDDHTLRAVRAALAMQNAIIQYNLSETTHHPMSFGIGIHVGPAVVGNIGTSQQMNFTAIGDTVNVAKRLQENARGGQILLSQAAYEAVREIAVVKPLGRMTVKGRTAAVQVYSLVGLMEEVI